MQDSVRPKLRAATSNSASNSPAGMVNREADQGLDSTRLVAVEVLQAILLCVDEWDGEKEGKLQGRRDLLQLLYKQQGGGILD